MGSSSEMFSKLQDFKDRQLQVTLRRLRYVVRDGSVEPSTHVSSGDVLYKQM